MNFVLSEMTFFRYFMPMILEGNRRGITSNVYVGKNQKYTNPQKYKKWLSEMSNMHHFNLYDLKDANHASKISFLIEGVDNTSLPKDNFKVSLTYMTDYRILYNSYVNNVDHIVFPSRSFMSFFNLKDSEKNLYLGSPKYDLKLNKKDCIEKYNLREDKRYALIVYPRHEQLSSFPLSDIVSSLKKLNYIPIIKSRAKHSCKDTKGCLYFEDTSWFPHTTMELIECSDIIINSGSTLIKECVMQKKPVINFDVKQNGVFSFLYNYGFAISNKTISVGEFESGVDQLTSVDLNSEFSRCIEDHLFCGVGTSSRILDYFGDHL